MSSTTTLARRPASGLRLALSLRSGEDGTPLLRRVLTDADLWDHRSEAWHAAFLRRGYLEQPLADVLFDLLPRYRTGRVGPLAGFTLASTNPGGQSIRTEFTLDSVRQLAIESSHKLVAEGKLASGDTYSYELLAEPAADGGEAASPLGSGRVMVTPTSGQLEYLRRPLDPIAKGARYVGPDEEGWSPVFYTEEALAKTERFARRGGNLDPPLETGCILIGTLCSCPERGELFVVVRDALEAQDAASQKFSLEYSGRTWKRMQSILSARRRQAGMETDRFVGQAHGHPFLPGSDPPCELCTQRPDLPCARTSCFVSQDDVRWHRAVFAHQPWALCHIFGLNARKENVDTLFGQRDAQLAARGFHVIEQFQPE